MSNVFPEPVWGDPQEAIEDCSALAYTGPSPFVLTGVFIRLLQYHFFDPDNIQNPCLKDYIWTNNDSGCISIEETDTDPEGEDASKILIAVSYRRDHANAGQRPALFVKREPVTFDTISMQHKTLPHIDKETGVYKGTTYQVQVQGRHSIICVGLNGAEADVLGEEVMFRMLHYQPIIRDDFRLGAFKVEGLSDVKELGSDPTKAFYTVVRLHWAYVYRWAVIPETPVAKRLHLTYAE